MSFADVKKGTRSQKVKITVENTHITKDISISSISVAPFELDPGDKTKFVIEDQTCPIGKTLEDETSCDFSVIFESDACSQKYQTSVPIVFFSNGKKTLSVAVSGVCASSEEDSIMISPEETSSEEPKTGVAQTNFILKRSGLGEGLIKVRVTTYNASAVAGEDYEYFSKEFTWTDGDMADKSFYVNVLADDIPEKKEYFTLSQEVLEGNATVYGAVIHIPGNDAVGGTLRFMENRVQLSESDGGTPVTLGIIRGGSLEGALRIAIEPEPGGTATLNQDYAIGPPNEVTWADGEDGVKEFQVVAIDNDDELEPPTEEAYLTLRLLSGEDVKFAEPRRLTLEILED